MSPYTFCDCTPVCKTDKFGMAPDDDILTRSDLVLTNEHTLPKSKFPSKAVDPNNLTMYTARENSFKGTKPAKPVPKVGPISLKDAKSLGPKAFSRAGQKMLRASYGDTVELKAIWDKASTAESGAGKVTYDTAAGKFNKLHLTDKSPEMSLLKEAYAEANICIDPNTGERLIDMKPSARALMWDEALKGKAPPPADLSPKVADAFNRLKAKGVAPATAGEVPSKTPISGNAGKFLQPIAPFMLVLQVQQNTPEVPVSTSTGAAADYDADLLEWKLGFRKTKPASVAWREAHDAKRDAEEKAEYDKLVAEVTAENERIEQERAAQLWQNRQIGVSGGVQYP